MVRETHSAPHALGDDMRQLRKARGLTLTDLSDLCGKSVSFLSKIERDLANPSLTALQEIAAALNVSTGWFFQNERPVPEEERAFVVRADNRRRLTYAPASSTDFWGFEDYLLSANLDGDLVMAMSRYAPGSSTGDDLYTHKGEEAGFVLSGTFELTLGEQVFLLNAGDSFSFPSTTPHRFHNPGTVETIIIWANTPISLKP
ncbi:cupin domain-containing protein [Coralliovum pocilloporae]|uniref:cupin domain-containing protein n=1 Tax=Coralliovum pocilloporae TaxID=3066369 RepID=UPI00330713FD